MDIDPKNINTKNYTIKRKLNSHDLIKINDLCKSIDNLKYKANQLSYDGNKFVFLHSMNFTRPVFETNDPVETELTEVCKKYDELIRKELLASCESQINSIKKKLMDEYSFEYIEIVLKEEKCETLTDLTTGVYNGAGILTNINSGSIPPPYPYMLSNNSGYVTAGSGTTYNSFPPPPPPPPRLFPPDKTSPKKCNKFKSWFKKHS